MPLGYAIFLYSFLFVTLYFQVFLLVSFVENFLEKRNKKEPSKENEILSYFPTVAVIVPCYNEEATVERTIQSLLDSDYPSEKLSIIAVNDGSADGTMQILSGFKSHPQITIINQENGGKHTALNAGILSTDAEIVGCLDADSRVAVDALAQSVKHFADPTIHATVPVMILERPNSIMRWLQKVEYEIAIFVRKSLGAIDAMFVAPGPLSLFRREEVFGVIGLYKKAHNTEDCEIALRMHDHGLRLVHADDAFVYTFGPSGLVALFKQRVRWVSGGLNNFWDYRRLYFNKRAGNLGFLVLPFMVISIMFSVLLFPFVVIQILRPLIGVVDRLSVAGIDSIGVFDWYSVGVDAYIFASLLLLFMLFVTVFLGRHTARERGISLDMFLVAPVYGLLAPFWLVKSTYNFIFAKKTSWR
ncbi:MAG: glycosyltransferase family 2 protein [Candidatus Nomurabacteria bacterium]|nr:glycosyltransferase family 2 protein [Candidatus Nomurabacteria bacterium]